VVVAAEVFHDRESSATQREGAEDLEAQGQPVGVLGPDREAQARVVTSWMTRATERVAEARRPDGSR
jgi:hypothetical protein